MNHATDSLQIFIHSAGVLEQLSLTVPLGGVVSLHGGSGCGKSTLCQLLETRSSTRFFPAKVSEDRDLLESSAGITHLPLVLSSRKFSAFSADKSLFDIFQLRSTFKTIFSPLLDLNQDMSPGNLFRRLEAKHQGQAVAIGIPLQSTHSSLESCKEVALKLGSDQLLIDEEFFLLDEIIANRSSLKTKTCSIVVDRLRIGPEKATRIDALEEHLRHLGLNEIALYVVDSTPSGEKRYLFKEIIPLATPLTSAEYTFEDMLKNPFEYSEAIHGLTNSELHSSISCGDLLFRSFAELCLNPEDSSATHIRYVASRLMTLQISPLASLTLTTTWGELSAIQRVLVTVVATLQPDLKGAFYIFDERFDILDKGSVVALLKLLNRECSSTQSTALLTASQCSLLEGLHKLSLPDRQKSRIQRSTLPKRVETFVPWSHPINCRPGERETRQRFVIERGKALAIESSDWCGLEETLLSKVYTSLKQNLEGLEGDPQFLLSTLVLDERGERSRKASTSIGSLVGAIRHLAELFALLPLSKEAGLTSADFIKSKGLEKNSHGLVPRYKGYTFHEALSLPISEVESGFQAHPVLQEVFWWLASAELDYLSLESPVLSLGSGERALLRLARYGILSSSRWILLLKSPQAGMDKHQVQAARGLVKELCRKGVTLIYSQQESLPSLGADTIIKANKYQGK